jgi:hypothetical protein
MMILTSGISARSIFMDAGTEAMRACMRAMAEHLNRA